MLDIDHIEDPRDFFSTHIFPHLGEKSLERPRELIGAQVVEDKVVDNNAPCIYFVAITPSGHGLRLIAERNAGESIPDAQLRIASACNISEYDGVTTDLARASYIMPWSYVLYCEPSGLDFADEDDWKTTTESFDNNNTDNLRPNLYPLGAQGEYSSPRQEVDCRGMLSKLSSNDNSSLSSNKPNIGCRSAAEVENQLTQLLLKTQNDHEEIILEVIDYRPDTDAGYDIPCPIELQQHKIDERRAAKRLSQLFREFASDTQRPTT
jgi:hypothetical protein